MKITRVLRKKARNKYRELPEEEKNGFNSMC